MEPTRQFDLSKLFGTDRAPDYDTGIRKRIPGYEALHETARALLVSSLRSDARLLVVGAGTGQELLTYAMAESGWRFVGVDLSPEMLDIARAKVARAGIAERIELRRGTAADLPEHERFDGATALLVMHFIAETTDKLAFLQSIGARLKPGASLLLADLCGSPGSPHFESLFAAWQAHWCATHGVARDDANMMKEFAERRARPGWIDEEQHLKLFAFAGFHTPVRFWSGLLFSAWLLRKA
jgi:tRNA (cmo5U34)-methyltransferase